MFTIYKNVLKISELEELRNWLCELRPQSVPGQWQGNGTHGGTRRLTIYEEDVISQEIYILAKQKSLSKVKELAKELTKASKYSNKNCLANVEFVGDGAFVPEHIDDNFGHKNCDHMRFNMLISKPLFGGMPVIGGKVLNLEEGDCWSFLANKHKHSCQRVQGPIERISASIGLLTHSDEER